ncbi:unnamed protein product [Rhizophagus irregularis]|nr:unnamed protein product [Rhizophagus irregularis]CAB5377604.1 unnamed protein product [Rhizophagus irregularis]
MASENRKRVTRKIQLSWSMVNFLITPIFLYYQIFTYYIASIDSPSFNIILSFIPLYNCFVYPSVNIRTKSYVKTKFNPKLSNKNGRRFN